MMHFLPPPWTRIFFSWERKFRLCLVFTYPYVELRSKLLSFDNKSKKRFFSFVLCSLIRNFVGENKTSLK